MKKALYTIIFCVICALVACSDDKEEQKPEPGKPDAKALRVGILPMTVCQPFLDAYAKGELDSLHADILLKHYNAFSECRHALEEGLVDCAVVDSSLLAIINSEMPAGKQFSAIPLNTKDSTGKAAPVFHFLTAKKARLQHISQMSDKIIAVDSHGTTHDIAFAATDTLRRSKQNVFLVQCEDMNVRLEMLRSGNVDAAVLPEPFASKAIKAGAKEIAIPKIRQARLVLAVSRKAKRAQIVKMKNTVKAF